MHIYGKNSVNERLIANPASVRRIMVDQTFDDPLLVKAIRSKNIQLQKVDSRHLSNLIRKESHIQGIVAEVEEFSYAQIEDLLTPEDKTKSIIFLDRIYDPQNLGGLIRTLACLGGFSLVIPRHKACGITETVLHVACGGENYVQVALESNLTNAMLKAKKAGYWIVGTSLDAEKTIDQFSFPLPVGLVLGSEGEGIRYGVDKHLDAKVKIPMKGAQLSLNVASAAAICCYEIDKQRSKQ